MTTRHRSRKTAFQVLYLYDKTEEVSTVQITHELQGHFEHFEIPENQREFAAKLIAGTLFHRQSIDQIIESRLKNWKISRIPPVDRNLLRLGIYELLYHLETPSSVIINEIIDLSKEFGSKNTSSYINGILDQVSKERDK